LAFVLLVKFKTRVLVLRQKVCAALILAVLDYAKQKPAVMT
jgi:hypothetical protein